MKFQTDKVSKEKIFNKFLKNVKQEVKNVPNEDPENLLNKSCIKNSILLYEYLLSSIDFSDEIDKEDID